MRLSACIQKVNGAAARLQGALTEFTRSETTLVWVLAAYTVTWTLYGIVTKAPSGLHSDMVRIVAWLRDLSLGYLQHPPLAAWLAAAWFSLFPLAEWSFYLLAMLMPVSALWIIWKILGDYLDPDKRLLGIVLLMLVPFFNFHALKYNVNTVLMPFWAATTLCFLHSYRTHSIFWAALAGVFAAASMYGKYWSVFLLAGLATAALTDKRRAAYFRSPAPLITTAVGILTLVPHLIWLAKNDFAPFTYAITVHGEKSLTATFGGIVGYLGGSLGYVAVPLVIFFVLVPAKPQVLRDIAWPREPERRLVATAFWFPLLLPVLGAAVSRSEITSLWSMSAFSLLPVLLLSSSRVVVRSRDIRWLLIAAIALPLVMLVASPIVAIVTWHKGPLPSSAHAQLLARQVDLAWRQLTPKPLRFVGGDTDLAFGVVTYAADGPRALPEMLPPEPAELAYGGAVYICFASDQPCRQTAAKYAAKVPGSRTTESAISRSFLQTLGRTERYALTLVPPQRLQ